MKKLIIGLAVVAMAMASQASTFKWTTTDATLGILLDNLNGNGSYVTTGGSNLKGNAALTAVLKIYSAGTEVGQASKTLSFDAYKRATVTVDISGTTASTAYTYELVLSGTQTDMTDYTTEKWDYTAATISTTIAGDVTTAASGTTKFGGASPTSWTVSGAKEITEPTPEPTSGLLMLLGMAGLALRRKQK